MKMPTPVITAILLASGDEDVYIDIDEFITDLQNYKNEWPLEVLLTAKPKLITNYSPMYSWSFNNFKRIAILVQHGWICSEKDCDSTIKALAMANKLELFDRFIKGKTNTNRDFIDDTGRFTIIALKYFCKGLYNNAFDVAIRVGAVKANIEDLVEATIQGLDERIRIQPSAMWKVDETRAFLIKLGVSKEEIEKRISNSLPK